MPRAIIPLQIEAMLPDPFQFGLASTADQCNALRRIAEKWWDCPRTCRIYFRFREVYPLYYIDRDDLVRGQVKLRKEEDMTKSTDALVNGYDAVTIMQMESDEVRFGAFTFDGTTTGSKGKLYTYKWLRSQGLQEGDKVLGLGGNGELKILTMQADVSDSFQPDEGIVYKWICAPIGDEVLDGIERARTFDGEVRRQMVRARAIADVKSALAVQTNGVSFVPTDGALIEDFSEVPETAGKAHD